MAHVEWPQPIRQLGSAEALKSEPGSAAAVRTVSLIGRIDREVVPGSSLQVFSLSVRGRIPGRRIRRTMPTVKTAISLDRELLQEIDAVATETGRPRSRVLADAAREYLRHRESRRLLDELNRAYPPEKEGKRPERELRRRKHRERVEGEW